MIVVLCQLSNFSAISCHEQITLRWDDDDDDDVHFVLDQQVRNMLLIYFDGNQIKIICLLRFFCDTY